MNTLTLGPGAGLIFRDFSPHNADGDPAARNVAGQATAYLFEPVALHPDLKLRDVFQVFEACPELHAVFSRNWSFAVCEEARKGPVPRPHRDHPAEAAGIEYLELYWSWALDTHSREYSGVHRLHLHGVGPVMEADHPTYGVNAGDRIRWSLSLTPVRELLDLPLRLCEELSIVEDDLDAKGWREPVATGRCTEMLLGQVIQGVLDELCFHGGPEEKAEVKDGLKAQLAEIEAGTMKTAPADDFFDALDRPGFEALFETLGGIRPSEVSRAMRAIDDDEPVGPALDRAFNGEVVVKTPFHGRSGRAFRKLFRTAGR